MEVTGIVGRALGKGEFMIAAVTPTDDRGSGDGSVTGDLLRGADKFAGRGGNGSSMPQEVGPNNLD